MPGTRAKRCVASLCSLSQMLYFPSYFVGFSIQLHKKLCRTEPILEVLRRLDASETGTLAAIKIAVGMTGSTAVTKEHSNASDW